MAHASGVNAGVMLRTRVKPVVGWSRLPMPLFLVQSVTVVVTVPRAACVLAKTAFVCLGRVGTIVGCL